VPSATPKLTSVKPGRSVTARVPLSAGMTSFNTTLVNAPLSSRTNRVSRFVNVDSVFAKTGPVGRKTWYPCVAASNRQTSATATLKLATKSATLVPEAPANVTGDKPGPNATLTAGVSNTANTVRWSITIVTFPVALTVATTATHSPWTVSKNRTDVCEGLAGGGSIWNINVIGPANWVIGAPVASKISTLKA